MDGGVAKLFKKSGDLVGAKKKKYSHLFFYVKADERQLIYKILKHMREHTFAINNGMHLHQNTRKCLLTQFLTPTVKTH